MKGQSIDISSPEYDNIHRYLQKLELNPDQAQVYIYLHVLGPSSVLSVSKALATGRTRLYPLLESLVGKQLVVVHDRHYGTTYEALGPQALEFLVHERETQTAHLREELLDVQSSLLHMSGQITKGSRVVEYRGLDGLKQINFNLTKAVGEFCVYEIKHMDENVGMSETYANRIRQIFIDKKITSRNITNNPEWSVPVIGATAASAIWRARYVNANVFNIVLEQFVYNDCVAYHHYDEDEIFGVEVYNEELAQQQRQLYEILWAMGSKIALPFVDVSDY